jgi:hypothetical protein
MSDQGKYEEAEEIHRQETVLGAEPPSTLRSMNNLGLALRDQGLGPSDQ